MNLPYKNDALFLVLCENVRLGAGYAFDKHLSRVSLTCFIMRHR